MAAHTYSEAGVFGPAATECFFQSRYCYLVITVLLQFCVRAIPKLTSHFCSVESVDKSEDDVERESQLLECRLTLTEERNAVMVPSSGSGIPGAPAERLVNI